MTTDTATPAVPSVRHDPGFGATFGSEWAKLRTARAPRRNLVLGTGLGIAFSVLLAVIMGATFSEWSPTEQADFDPLLYPLSGSLFIAIFFAAVGVNVVASEYTSGMIRLTLTTTPRRRRVLTAKALAVALATFVFGLVAMAGMFGVSHLIYGAYDLPTADLASGRAVRTFALIALIGPLFPVIAVFVTFLLRSTAAALSTVLALIFAPSIFGGLLPRWWRENVISLLPGPASDSVAIGHLSESDMYLHPVLGFVVVVAWVVVFSTLARLVLDRRDA